MKDSISFTQVNRDANGNERFVCHYLDFISENDIKPSGIDGFSKEYNLAKKRAKQFGGKVYRGNEYGGGFVFKPTDLKVLERNILSFVNSL